MDRQICFRLTKVMVLLITNRRLKITLFSNVNLFQFHGNYAKAENFKKTQNNSGTHGMFLKYENP